MADRHTLATEKTPDGFQMRAACSCGEWSDTFDDLYDLDDAWEQHLNENGIELRYVRPQPPQGQHRIEGESNEQA